MPLRDLLQPERYGLLHDPDLLRNLFLHKVVRFQAEGLRLRTDSNLGMAELSTPLPEACG